MGEIDATSVLSLISEGGQESRLSWNKREWGSVSRD